ncbi:MAG: hypothetical protein WBA22_10125 [Candidatus Methanofastidiosia archaeon]
MKGLEGWPFEPIECTDPYTCWEKVLGLECLAEIEIVQNCTLGIFLNVMFSQKTIYCDSIEFFSGDNVKGLKGWPFEPIESTAPYTLLGEGAGSGMPC